MDKKHVTVGVLEGHGAPVPYRWNVWILALAHEESIRTFSPEQHHHLVLQVQELAREMQPSHCKTVSVDMIDDYHELRDRGGVFGAKNARVFFGLDKDSRAIVILGAIAKQNNGKTPDADRIRMRRRWRKYKDGDYGKPS